MIEYSTTGPDLPPPGYRDVSEQAPFKPEMIPVEFLFWDADRRAWIDLHEDGRVPLWCFWWKMRVAAPENLLEDDQDPFAGLGKSW